MKDWRPVLDFRPTQFALGMAEVAQKVAKLQKMSKSELAECVESKPIPVVISPDKELYMTDHHHFGCAAWQVGVDELRFTVVADLSKTHLDYATFWETMVRSHWAHLFDQFGEGPRPPLYLPLDVRGLADDPYRSLAWLVREAGGFAQTEESFAEFHWAAFFRKADLLKDGRGAFDQAVAKALDLAKSHKARHLPGYVGKGA